MQACSCKHIRILSLPSLPFSLCLVQGREPIDILMTPLRRHTQTCIYCNQSCGVCVECSDSTCKKWFHITCGQRNDIFLEYTPKEHGADVIVSYCKEHGKRWAKKSTKASKK